MASKVLGMNSISKSRARVITIIVHIILILLAVLPLLALKPVTNALDNKNPIRTEKAAFPTNNLP